MTAAISLKSAFGAAGDGIADDTAALQAALDAGREVMVEPGTYRCRQLYLRHGSSLAGTSRTGCVLKLSDDSHCNFLTHQPGMRCDDVSISRLTIDGNWSGYDNAWNMVRPYNPFDPAPSGPGNHYGDGVVIDGVSAKLRDLTIQNVAGTGLHTKGSSDTWRLAGITPHLQNIVISQTKGHGWIHDGPSDIWADSIYPVNSSLGALHGYVGVLIRSNGRFTNLHPYNLSNTNIVASAGAHVASSGNNFSNCHFEGGHTALVVSGHSNTFDASTIYAPRGDTLAIVSGSLNRLNAVLLGSPGKRGVDLGGSYCTIDITDNGCEAGGVNFVPGAAGNIVRSRGYHSGAGYSGTPDPSSEVDILIGSASVNSRLRQLAAT